jgi:hypothetical protein
MARVPVYDGPQVRDAPLQPALQGPVDASSGLKNLSQGIGQLGAGVEQYQLREAQDEAFKMEAALRSDWQVTRAKLREQYKGDSADQYGVEASAWWADAQTRVGGALSPAAKRLADRSLSTLRGQAQADTLGYVETEKRGARRVNFETAQSAKARDFANAVTPENAIAQGRVASADITEAAIRYASLEGHSSDVGKALAQQQLDKFHASVALSLADRNAVAARDYLKEFGSALPLEARNRINDSVTKSFNMQEGARMAAANALLPLGEQLAKGAKIDDPELRRSYDMHVQENAGRLKAAKQQTEQAAADAAWTQYVDLKKPVPAALRAAMGETNLQQLIRFEQERARHFAAEGVKPIKTDPATHRDLWAMMGDNPDKFKTENLRQYGLKLSDADYEQLTARQTAMRSGKGEKDLISFNNKVNAAIEQSGLVGTAKAQERGAFRRAAQLDFERATANGKPLTPMQEDELLDGLTKDTVLKPGYLWDTTGPAYKAHPDDRKYAKGKTYTDAGGNKARYVGGGKWEDIK